jgi:16S rRNA (cytosine967-C5)-methyltransferase
VSQRARKVVRSESPRQVALDVVRAVGERGAYANLLLPERLTESGLSGRDAAFATELTYGTLRWQGTYDRIVDACVNPESMPLDAVVRDVMRIGCHQVLSMNVPDHAAVTTTVELAKRSKARRAAGLINAVLRRIARTSLSGWLDTLTAGLESGSDTSLAIRHSHPVWLVAEFRRALAARGRPRSELDEALAADNIPAPVTVVARPGICTVEELLSGGAARGRWSPYAAILPSGNPAELAPIRERRAGVQDEGSQLVTLALAEVPTLTDGTEGTEGTEGKERWLDMCAGPGGKAALLAGLAATRGAGLEAWEVQPHRARMVQQQVGESTRVRTVDAADAALVEAEAGGFDRVMLDAPCSGAGALRRRPEARWRKSPADLEVLVRGQQRLLRAAIRLVKPGGVVAYVTCSPLLQETSEVVGQVLADCPGIQQVDARPLMPDHLPDLGDELHLQLWPHLHTTDAMFLSLLRRLV